MWPGSRAVMWTRPGDDATTSRCICGAAIATAARSNTSNWPICPHCPRRRSPRSAVLAGATMVPAETVCMITRSLPHGHVAAVTAMARKLGWPALLGPACRQRDLVVALIVSRVVRPGSKLSTAAWWPDTTLGADLGVAGASTDEVYAAWTGWPTGR